MAREGRPESGRAARRSGRDRGATALELAMYLPILFIAVFVTVQFALTFLGNQAAQAAARETARVARVGGGSAAALGAARARGLDYAATVGHGVLLDPAVEIRLVGTGEVRATVTGRALQVVPGVPAPRLEQTVQGPIEDFRPDL